jgi:hypothetical protein
MKKLLAYLVFALISITSFAEKTGNPEFDGYCTYSLANGSEMKTSCAVFWISSEDKLYCFANEFAKKEFLKDAEKNLRKARAFYEDPAFWEKLKKEEG